MRAFAISAIVACTLFTGCATTMGDLGRGANNLGKTLESAVTPAEVMAYKAFADRNTETILATLDAMKMAQLPEPIAKVSKVQFRDQVGRVFEAEAVQAFRFPVPQDAIDADAAEVKLLLAAMGARFVEWNGTEPIELVAVSASNEGAALMAAQLKRAAQALQVSTKVGTVANVGYAGVELRMLNPLLQRSVK